MTSGTEVAVLASGRGSNLRALLAAIDQGTCKARVCAVISDKSDAPALDLARERGLGQTRTNGCGDLGYGNRVIE